jgi:hypothetical protein
MPESVCSDRLKKLEVEIRTLEASRDQLLMDQEAAPEAPPQELLDRAVSRLEEAVDQGEPQTVKALLGALIDRVEVEGRHAIRPFIRVDGVRIVSGQRRRTGIEPEQEAAQPRGRVSWRRARRVRRSEACGAEADGTLYAPPGFASSRLQGSRPDLVVRLIVTLDASPRFGDFPRLSDSETRSVMGVLRSKAGSGGKTRNKVRFAELIFLSLSCGTQGGEENSAPSSTWSFAWTTTNRG